MMNGSSDISVRDVARTSNPPLRFLALFAALLLVFSMGVFLPEPVLRSIIRMTGSLIVWCAGIVGISASFDGAMLTVSGFRMEIILECTALQYIGMYAAGVIAYPLKSVRSKARALVFGVGSILLINVARIIIIGQVGVSFPGFFEFVHEYLWQGLFGAIVFCIWLVWVQGIRVRLSAGKTVLFIVCTVAVSVAVTSLLVQITAGIVWLSQKLFRVLPMLGDFLVAVRNGLIVVMRFRGGAFDMAVYDISMDIFAAGLILPLLAVTSASVRTFLGRAALSVLCLLLMHLLSVSGIGYLLAFGISDDQFRYFYWYLHVMSLMMPFILFLAFRRKVRAAATGPVAVTGDGHTNPQDA